MLGRRSFLAMAAAVGLPSLAACAGHEPAWRLLMQWAEKGMLSTAQKKDWAGTVMKIAGRDRPDFAIPTGVLGN